MKQFFTCWRFWSQREWRFKRLKIRVRGLSANMSVVKDVILSHQRRIKILCVSVGVCVVSNSSRYILKDYYISYCFIVYLRFIITAYPSLSLPSTFASTPLILHLVIIFPSLALPAFSCLCFLSLKNLSLISSTCLSEKPPPVILVQK